MTVFYVYVKHYVHIIGRYVIKYITSKLPPHLYQELIIEEEFPLFLTLKTYIIILNACGQFNIIISILIICSYYIKAIPVQQAGKI